MKKTSNNKFVFIIILLILILFFTISTIIYDEFCSSDIAYAESRFVSDDYNGTLAASDVISDGIKITEYPQLLYAHNASLSDGKISIAKSDDIIKFIPLAFFALTESFDLYIGKEWGFFIKVEEDVKTHKLLTVLVFDIENNNNLLYTYDTIEVKVSPIFQYQYALLKGKPESISVNDMSYTVEYGEQTARVIPVPNQSGEFNQITKYYLKDISFGAALYNEQELNIIDDGYRAESDKGSFFISSDYKYNGVYRDEHGVQIDIDPFLIVDTISFTLGAISNYLPPSLSVITGALGTILSGISLIDSYIDLKDSLNTSPVSYVSTDNGQITANCLYTTKDGQLAHYVDENGYPTLTKAVRAVIHGDDGTGNVWYGVGNYAEGIFRVTNSSDNEDDWQTRYVQDIRLTVVDEDGVEYGNYSDENLGTFSQGQSQFVINQDNYKTIMPGQQNRLYLFENGHNCFEFVAPFTGRYEFVFEEEFNTNFLVRNVSDKKIATGQIIDNRVIVELTAHSLYNVRFSNDKKAIRMINFKLHPVPAEGETDCELREQVFRFDCRQSGLYNVSYNYRAITEAVYMVDDEGTLFLQERSTNLFFHEGRTYYICMKYDYVVPSRGCDVYEDTDTLTTKNNLKVQSPTQFDYFKFVAPENGDYILTLSGYPDSYVTADFDLLDEEGEKIDIPEKYEDGIAFLRNLKAGAIYYIGIQNSNTKNIHITQNEAKYVWKERVGDSWQTLEDNRVEMYRNSSKEFCLFVEGVPITHYCLINPNNLDVTESSGTVRMKPTFKHNGGIALLGGCEEGEDRGMLFPYPLYIVGKFNPKEVSFKESDIIYDNCIRIRWDMPSDVTNVNLVLDVADKTSQSIQLNSVTSYDLLPKLLQLAATDASCTLKSIRIENEDVLIDQKVHIDCLYRQTGNEYYIWNALHLSNLRYATDSIDRKLATNIDLSSIPEWHPIVSLNNSVDGNGYGILNLRIVVDTSTRYWGLFGINNAAIKNFVITHLDITSRLSYGTDWYYVGGIVGTNNGIIDNCHILDADFNILRDYVDVGGLVGVNSYSGTIGFSTFEGNSIRGGGDIGGIAGQNYNLVEHCNVNKTVFEYDLIQVARSVGGIVGHSTYGVIRNCGLLNSHFIGRNNNVALDAAMGYIIGSMTDGQLLNLGYENCDYNIDGIDTKHRKYCFNGSWPFYGRIENCTVV